MEENSELKVSLENRRDLHSKEERLNFVIYMYKQNKKTYISWIEFKNYYNNYFKENIDEAAIQSTLIELYFYDYIIICENRNEHKYLDKYLGKSNEEIKAKFQNLLNGKNLIYLNLYQNDIPDFLLDQVENLQNKSAEILNKIQNYNKDILTIMALFVSIVALLTSNVSAIGNLTAIGIITMNISLVISILIIFLLINNIIGKESSKFTNNIVSITSIIILSIILLILVFKSNLDSTLINNEKDSFNNYYYNQSFQINIKGGNDN